MTSRLPKTDLEKNFSNSKNRSFENAMLCQYGQFFLKEIAGF